MRKPMVAGNWKMNGLKDQVIILLESLKQGTKNISHTDIVVLPTFVHLQWAQDLLNHSNIALGAQNLYVGTSGAFTGEVAGQMLSELGCRYVLVGHSERRAVFGEDLNTISAKFKSAQDAGLIPILCIGETSVEREKNKTDAIISEQLESVIEDLGIEAFKQAIVAYEPVWAIGTGLTASPEQAQAVHLFIREKIAQHDKSIANSLSILYGGSVKADNAAGLFAMPDIDGGLVGGASLDAKSFLAICQAAENSIVAKSTAGA